MSAQRPCLWLAWRALVIIDEVGHALFRALGIPFPLLAYRVCCARENLHERLYPAWCACCWRAPGT